MAKRFLMLERFNRNFELKERETIKRETKIKIKNEDRHTHPHNAR
jgi:hypothetical protein